MNVWTFTSRNESVEISKNDFAILATLTHRDTIVSSRKQPNILRLRLLANYHSGSSCEPIILINGYDKTVRMYDHRDQHNGPYEYKQFSAVLAKLDKDLNAHVDPFDYM